ncbi:MAG: translation elongation factor Ts [Methylococcaceae bacterium TMED69]|nr:MAG: translation elongation factor Ts [Methylococcaceae bacterium TMED69]
MTISASMVKELRERTGAGMMDCKKALVENSGDFDKAIEYLRKTGVSKAEKKLGRVAAEGAIGIQQNSNKTVLIEVNCETDFVANDENFKLFVEKVSQIALEQDVSSIDNLLAVKVNDKTLKEAANELSVKVGEKIDLRRIEVLMSGVDSVSYYLHGGKIGAAVTFEGSDGEAARDIAMHVAATAPAALDETKIPLDLLQREQNVFMGQAESSGKPADIVEKMVVGKLKKFIKENTLVGQMFVKNQDQTVGDFAKSKNLKLVSFIRMAVGDGIEKKTEDFAEEVAKQVGKKN